MGAAGALARRRRGSLSRALFRAATWALLAFTVALLGAICFSTAAYTDLRTLIKALTSDEVLFSIKLTILTTTLSTVICMVWGIPVAYALSRYRIPASTLVDTIIDLPIVLPPMAGGIVLLLFFGYYLGDVLEKWGLRLTYTQRGIIVAQVLASVSFAVRTIKAAFDSVNPRMEQVARTLGSSEFRVFLRITLPQARNGILAGAVITWMRVMGLFGPVALFAGMTRFYTEIMPISIFLHESVGELEEAVALTLALLLLSLATLVVFKKLGGRGYLW